MVTSYNMLPDLVLIFQTFNLSEPMFKTAANERPPILFAIELPSPAAVICLPNDIGMIGKFYHLHASRVLIM